MPSLWPSGQAKSRHTVGSYRRCKPQRIEATRGIYILDIYFANSEKPIAVPTV